MLEYILLQIHKTLKKNINEITKQQHSDLETKNKKHIFRISINWGILRKG